ncbi:pilus assembly protein PilM [Arthrobacter sp. A2-55]|uniref:pilus assembly protein PilM n=1 Tax=Arthrobacter sp. A2-55 TaxID=2897337 RepID=UPI0021CDAABE|nr:pilus assembly protein PilM [Arthrobacter sp. A2-55]MCU6480155.1 pilus assembly protein PilM [Arthrobacter sp. A2-55]
MAENVIGIDFGSAGIKLVEVKNAKGTTTVIRQAYLPLSPGQIVDGSPVQSEVAAIASDLKALLAEKKFTARDAVMGYGSVDDIFVNRARTPWHAPKDFHTAVAFDIVADKSLLLGAPEEVIIDAVIFDEFTDVNDKRMLDVLLCGVTSKLADRQASILTKAGLRVAGADLSGLAALRAIAPVTRAPDNLDVLVDVGSDVLTVLIHDNGKPYSLTLQSDVAGQAASGAIAEELQDDDVERVNREKVVFSRDYRVRKAVDEYCFKVCSAIRSAIRSYLDLRKSPAAIAGVTLIGGGALLHGLRNAVEENMGVGVVIGTFDPGIDGAPERYDLGPVLSADYTVAVGLAMGATA